MGKSCVAKCELLVTVLAVLYILVSVAAMLLARLYIQGYYCTAHVASLSVIIALFWISHHHFRIRQCLGFSRREFAILQVALNFGYLMFLLAAAVGYTILVVLSININFDYVTASIWAYIDTIGMFCLLVSCCCTARAKSSQTYTLTQPIGYQRTGSYQDIPLQSKHNGTRWGPSKSQTGGSDLLKSTKPKRSFCARACILLLRLIFALFYFIFQLVFMLSVCLTALHSCQAVFETVMFREDAHLHTVQVKGHRPLALFMKCTGSGNDTILFESGLGGSAYMALDFLPQYLGDEYRVCVHDRRGYGWSESLEHDYIDVLVKEPQWTGSNIEFITALINQTEMQTPFYYMGHSYGGHHIAYMAAKHPDMIKGLVFLDSAKFSPVRSLRNLMELVANFHPLGLGRIAVDTGLLDYEAIFGDVIEFSTMSPDVMSRLWASLNSGLYFAANVRENKALVFSDYAMRKLNESLAGVVIQKPVLVIDAGNNDNTDWFPAEHFPFYNQTNHHVVEGSNHHSLVYSHKYSRQVSDLIGAFIQSLT